MIILGPVAVAKNNVIGKSNDLPWYIPEDLKRFKEITTGHVVVMGRKTYESIIARLGKPLPNRKNVVITSNLNYEVPVEVEKFSSLEEAVAAHKDETVFLIGGQRIFEEGINLAKTIYMTELHKDYDGDVYFPEFDKTQWNKVVEESHPDFDFVTYIKK
ncbi:MAG: dihydrofolate reductase [Candidatus Doudnabacteria bacterium]|nr:dihydrofolate reductase [Candidatus Doudnabacteria bacterium]